MPDASGRRPASRTRPPGRAEAGRQTQRSKAPTTDPVDAEPTIKFAPNCIVRIAPAPSCGWVRTFTHVAATARPGRRRQRVHLPRRQVPRSDRPTTTRVHSAACPGRSSASPLPTSRPGAPMSSFRTTLHARRLDHPQQSMRSASPGPPCSRRPPRTGSTRTAAGDPDVRE